MPISCCSDQTYLQSTSSLQEGSGPVSKCTPSAAASFPNQDGLLNVTVKPKDNPCLQMNYSVVLDRLCMLRYLRHEMLQAQAFRVVRDQHVKYTEKPAREGEPVRAASALALVVCMVMQCTQKGRVRCPDCV